MLRTSKKPPARPSTAPAVPQSASRPPSRAALTSRVRRSSSPLTPICEAGLHRPLPAGSTLPVSDLSPLKVTAVHTTGQCLHRNDEQGPEERDRPDDLWWHPVHEV